MRDPYDGLPYYCVNCGERYTDDCRDGDCVIESAAAAQSRALKRRATGSDFERARAAAVRDV